MTDVNSLLAKRLTKTENPTNKMAAMAKQSATGHLTSFSGVFSVTELSAYEKECLEAILSEYATGSENITEDLTSLISITSEVKAINNQAAILHGERIKKAQTLLKRYREGAFTEWLITTYGNRQTPYNLLQYYEFYQALPAPLKTKAETMPRQAIYTLASRDAPLPEKQKIVKNYNGESKKELLDLIRETFPLEDDDKRKHNLVDGILHNLKRTYLTLEKRRLKLTKKQQRTLLEILDDYYALLND